MEDCNMETDQLKVYPSEIFGEINILGAKNSVLRLLAASILTEHSIVLLNYPTKMLDVEIQEEMLKALGKVVIHGENKVEIIGQINNTSLVWKHRSIRNTLLILGCLLTKCGGGKVPLPGGCPLGDRKYDIHVQLMEAMGAKVWEEDGYLCAKNDKPKLQAINFELPIRSTGATENAILMASLAEGTSRIWNPHVRPEILDLISLLNKMGAKIQVCGQELIIIEGVSELKNIVTHEILCDNMQALTYLIAGAIAGKELCIRNFPFNDLEVPLAFLRFSGLKYYKFQNELIVKRCNAYPVDISTGPYPGINSDMQPLFAVWGALSKGTSTIIDLRFVGRYGYADEMKKLGVVSEIQDNKLILKGGNVIHGGLVRALDLRAGAALMLLALVADSPVTIQDFWMVERGYDNVIHVLKSVGVKISSIIC